MYIVVCLERERNRGGYLGRKNQNWRRAVGVDYRTRRDCRGRIAFASLLAMLYILLNSSAFFILKQRSYFLLSFANVFVLKTSEGLVLIDTSSFVFSEEVSD